MNFVPFSRDISVLFRLTDFAWMISFVTITLQTEVSPFEDTAVMVVVPGEWAVIMPLDTVAMLLSAHIHMTD